MAIVALNDILKLHSRLGCESGCVVGKVAGRRYVSGARDHSKAFVAQPDQVIETLSQAGGEIKFDAPRGGIRTVVIEQYGGNLMAGKLANQFKVKLRGHDSHTADFAANQVLHRR